MTVDELDAAARAKFVSEIATGVSEQFVSALEEFGPELREEVGNRAPVYLALIYAIVDSTVDLVEALIAAGESS